MNIIWGQFRQAKKNVIDREMEHCPFCSSKQIVKFGRRQRKHQTIQYYRCKDCRQMFTPQIYKGKKYPLKIILDGISYYNLGYTKADSCRLLKEKHGHAIRPNTLSNWIAELDPLCRYSRLRPGLYKRYGPFQIIQSAVLNHKQIYHYRYHQGKLDCLLGRKEFARPRFRGVKDYLENISSDCPHHYFRTDNRSSQAKADFDFSEVYIPGKENHATRLAQLLLQAVTNNKKRHDALQQFMLVNDSVTIAMEAPIYLKPEDIKHFTQKLKFKIPFRLDRIMTGHIDLLQLRGRHVHILDYKPRAKTNKPYAQLLIYALALSRLTGLKLMDFKCAWFDENHYFEFFPLQLVHKLK